MKGAGEVAAHIDKGIIKMLTLALPTSSSLCPQTLNFIRELGRKITIYSEVQKFSNLMQRLSVAAQQGNAALVLGTMTLCGCV